ncbi:MAG TPA: molybdate ABC transporter substrate-binding protein [Lacipirellulaceae bacterium]|nr:molybdate ABC transporter substrate-binding protein [Lacipirellulaceae bacterium]
MAKSQWGRDWEVGLRVWVERAGEAVVGEGRAELLAAIDREHSITKAARAAGMSYRRAWNLIQATNAAAGAPLVEATTGGAKGGGARLTDRGRLALRVYDRVRSSLVDSAANTLRRSINDTGTPSDCIHLAASISLQEAVGQILAEFALRHPAIHVRAIFGASNELADHLLAGAPGDVFMSAEPAELDRLEAAKLLVRDSRQTVAQNGLAIVGAASASTIKRPEDLLTSRFKRIALAEPACPLGHYSKEYLEKARLYDKLQPKVLHVDNSRAVLAAVVSGAARAGIAFSSDATGQNSSQLLLSVPTSQAAATYVAAMIDREKSPDGVRVLFDFLHSNVAKRCYRRCGLWPVSPSASSKQSKSRRIASRTSHPDGRLRAR